MDEPEADDLELAEETGPAPRLSRRRRIVLGLVGVSLLGLGAAWLARERIARGLIADQLDRYQLPASYHLDSVGPTRQVLSQVRIGDPAHPDLTIEKVEIDIVPTFGLPVVGRVKLVRPRLAGTWTAARASFGSLDRLIFAKTGRPSGLPDIDLVLVDGRASIEAPGGPVAVGVSGAGNLHNGFAGQLQASAGHLAAMGCAAEGSALSARLSSRDARLALAGPLTVKALACSGRGMKLRDVTLTSELAATPELDGLDGTLALRTGPLNLGSERAATLGGETRLSLRGADLTARYHVEAKQTGGGLAEAGSVSAEGILRGRDSLARLESEGALSVGSLGMGRDLAGALDRLARSGEGTPVGPLAAQLRTGLARATPGNRLTARYTLRSNAGRIGLAIPEARLSDARGRGLVVANRLLLAAGKGGPLAYSGHARGLGTGLPGFDLAIAREGGSTTTGKLSLAPLRAGDAALAVPELRFSARANGAVSFTGRAQVSGAFPGGRAEGLALPLEGQWSRRGGLALGSRCARVGFARLEVSSLVLADQAVSVCPGTGGAIVRAGPGGTRFAARIAAIDLAGRIGAQPARIASGPVVLNPDRTLSARDLRLDLGPAGAQSHLALGDVSATLGQITSGHFGGGEVRLAPVPLDIVDASGDWRFAAGALTVGGASLRVKDRETDARFYPLIAHDAQFSLRGGHAVARAMLREPTSDRAIVEVRLDHDLASGRGSADLDLPGVVFDTKLQPDTLSYLAQGVIALAKGTVTGTGRIDWNQGKITSTGRFSTDGLDFAAAFGPVRGTSGTVEFTDLLGLVTAPDQQLKIAAINPGIEVGGGVASFQLEPGRVLVINGGHWPFIDGTLDLLPTRMVLGGSQARYYTLKVEGVNAAKFISELELDNIAASGTFDGTLPTVFDQNGGRIVGGMLVSRPPGGNLSYLGQLTYKDMGAMANFAFQSLRSLDFRAMQIGLDGDLAGEVVTRVRIEGVRQGDGARRNFITRQLATLPIQFNINIRAPFQRLIASFRSIYDPNYVRDPRSLGLVDAQGNPLPAPNGKKK